MPGSRSPRAAPALSYLNGDAIIEAAQASGAQAVHPGYGFLAENAGFARACAAAGIVFIGPPPEAIEAMGSKSAAKALMEAAGVPVVPGYHGDAQDDATLITEAQALGTPLLIKPVAGGGGKGMHRVADLAEGFARDDAAAETTTPRRRRLDPFFRRPPARKRRSRARSRTPRTSTACSSRCTRTRASPRRACRS